jgi:hypothetical protein
MNNTRNGGIAPKLPQRHSSRRLSDHILVAFHHACDQAELEVARQLLSILEMRIAAPRLPHPGRDRRRETETLVAAYERLWHLRHPTLVER